MVTPGARFLIILLLAAQFPSAFGQSRFDGAAAREAAYYGEVESLARLVDDAGGYTAAMKSGLRPENVVLFAMIGNRTEIIGRMIAYGFPTPGRNFSDLFANEHMTTELARFLVNNVPEFRDRHGEAALSRAVAALRTAVVEVLLDSGVDPNAGSSPPLLTAVYLGGEEVVRVLLKHGADPNAGYPGRRPVDVALKMKSARMLKQLDREARFAAKVAEFEAMAPPADSPFVGLWAHRPQGGGFGGVAVRLLADGTGLTGGDVGGSPLTWAHVDTSLVRVKSISIPPAGSEFDYEFELYLREDGALEMRHDPSAPPSTILLKEDEERLDSSGARYPLFARLERAWLTPERDLVLRISGRCLTVALHRLVEGARKTSFAERVNQSNVLRWSEFVKSPPCREVVEGAQPIPVESKNASPAYSSGWTALHFDHETAASLKEGENMTFFPSGSERPSVYGEVSESLLGFALLSAEPFAHERNWLMVYLLRSRVNDRRNP